VIALTARLKRIDNFYFVLMHEIAHLWAGDEGSIDVLEVSPSSAMERQADKRAGEWLIPQQAYDRILARSEGRFSAQFIEQQALLLNRHPGILVGRLQRDEYIPWSYLRPFLVNVGSYLDAMKEVQRPS
jgi:HTH-type transcriptional regulator/antitoxin HigA